MVPSHSLSLFFIVKQIYIRNYTLNPGPPITNFLSSFCCEMENFEQIFVLVQPNTAFRQQITTAKLLHKYFKQTMQYYTFSNWYHTSIQLLSITKLNFTQKQIEGILCGLCMDYSMQIHYTIVQVT